MESIITKLLHSRYFGAVSLIYMIIGTYYAYTCGDILYISGDRGLILPSANEWMPTGQAEMWVNIGLNIVIAISMIIINRRYNFIKALTVLYVGLFAVMQMSLPDMMLQLYSGSVIAVVLLFCIGLLFSCYDKSNPYSNRKIFLIFLLLSVGLMTQYAYAVYIPVFIIGCIQMRIFSLRVLLSAVLGVITPWLIAFGGGLLEIENLHWPHFVTLFGAFEMQEMLLTLIAILLTIVLLWTSEVLTLFKVLTYNARRRSYNGFMTVLAAVSTIAMIGDYTNMVAYFPIVNICSAYAVSHFFAIHYNPKSYIPILSVFALYITLFVWTIVI